MKAKAKSNPWNTPFTSAAFLKPKRMTENAHKPNGVVIAGFWYIVLSNGDLMISAKVVEF